MNDPTAPRTGRGPSNPPVLGESRWPMALAVLTLMAFSLFSPSNLTALPGWLPASIEGILLVILIVGDPGRIDRETRWLHWVSVALVTVLIASALGNTIYLILDLVSDSAATKTAGELLIGGAKVWLTNNIAFALLYWEFDGDGPAARAYGLPEFPDFAFPQLQSPELAPPDWRPQFIDYLYIGFTNANAFSPTDTLPMTHWAKVAMASQALISFAIVGLVLAQAVNAFGS